MERQGGGPGGQSSSCPALLAVRADNSAVLRLLVEEQGADPFSYRFGEESSLQPDDEAGGDGERDRGCFGVFHGSVFETACRDGRLRCVRYLLGRLLPEEDVRRKVVYYGAVAAVEGDGDEVLRLLLEEGAMDPNAVLDNDIGEEEVPSCHTLSPPISCIYCYYETSSVLLNTILLTCRCVASLGGGIVVGSSW